MGSKSSIRSTKISVEQAFIWYLYQKGGKYEVSKELLKKTPENEYRFGRWIKWAHQHR